MTTINKMKLFINNFNKTTKYIIKLDDPRLNYEALNNEVLTRYLYTTIWFDEEQNKSPIFNWINTDQFNAQYYDNDFIDFKDEAFNILLHYMYKKALIEHPLTLKPRLLFKPGEYEYNSRYNKILIEKLEILYYNYIDVQLETYSEDAIFYLFMRKALEELII